jgi:hypothetical protein
MANLVLTIEAQMFWAAFLCGAAIGGILAFFGVVLSLSRGGDGKTSSPGKAAV